MAWTLNQTVIGKRTDPFDKRMQTALDNTLMCDCCGPHQYNKCATWAPYGADVSWGVADYGWSSGSRNGIGACQPTGPAAALCKCNCRHLSRMICKLHPDSPDVKLALACSANPHKEDWERLCMLNELAEQVARTEFSVSANWGRHKQSDSVRMDIGIVQECGMAGVWG
jgi:hypothetical protein